MGSNNNTTQDGQDIDWYAIFAGITNQEDQVYGHDRNGGSNLVAGPNDHRGGIPVPHLIHGNPPGESVWDHLFPPPIPTPPDQRQSTYHQHPPPTNTPNDTPRSVEAGPSRPRLPRFGTYPYSAPITPNPFYTTGRNGNPFGDLSQSLYLPESENERIISNRDLPTIPPPFSGDNVGQRGLRGYQPRHQPRLSLDSRNTSHEDLLNRESQWQISDTSSSFASLNYQPAPLNPPQPNTPSWATYHQAINALSCSVDPRHTPPERINSSTESTPNIPPPPTPLQSAVGTPGGMMDNEDKIQRNTLASAKFRAKRKQHVQTVQRRISELENEKSELAKDVGELKQENKFLREMVDLKYGLAVKSEATGNSDEPNSPIQGYSSGDGFGGHGHGPDQSYEYDYNDDRES